MVVEEGRPVMVLVEKSGREKEGVVISPPGTTKVPSHLQMSLFHVSREERSSLSAGVQSSGTARVAVMASMCLATVSTSTGVTSRVWMEP